MSIFTRWGPSMARAARRALVLAAAAFAATHAAPAQAEEHKDAKRGYSFVYPRKWLVRPVATDERWVVAKFESDREFDAADAMKTWSWRYRPWLDVVVIPLALENRKGGTVETDQDGTMKLRQAAPFKDLKGYLETTLQYGQGGFFFSKEEESTVGGLKCMQYEVTFEKDIDRPKKVYGWAFYTSDVIYGLVGESLTVLEDKIKPDLMAAFKTFKAFPRTGGVPGGEHTGEDVVIKDPDKDANLSDDERARRRDQLAMQRLARIKESLAADWIVKESAHYVAVSHADVKYTKNVLDHCEALRGWLEDNLGYIGSGYAGKAIIRICKDSDEHMAFAQTGGWRYDDFEVPTYKDRDGWSNWAMSSLNGGIFDIWFRDKNQAAYWAFPAWISSGLRTMIGDAASKGSKIEFKADVWDRVSIAEQRRGGSLPAAKSFFTMTQKDLYRSWEEGTSPNASFVKFLTVGAARRNAKFKNVFADYVKSIVFVVDEREAKAAKERKAAAQPSSLVAAPDAGPKDEKEEDAMIQERQRRWQEQETDFLDELFKRVFSDWTEKDWSAMTESYHKDVK